MKKVCKNEKCNCDCKCCSKDCECCKDGCKSDCDCKCGCGCCNNNWMKNHNQIHEGGSGAVYGLGMIGAAIYFISNSSGFWMVILAILKAIIWPVFLVLEAFKALLG